MSDSIDQIKDGATKGFDIDAASIEPITFANAISKDDFERSNEFFNNNQYTSAIDYVMRSIAGGGFNNRLESFMAGIDRYNRNSVQQNIEHSGLTFITRPRLCLNAANIKADRRFEALDVNEPCMSHAIRCLLDTKYSSSVPYGAFINPLLDVKSPWFTPLMNGLSSISGWPDPVLQTATTPTGFFSEDQTYALGYDDLNKTYDLSLSFKDPQHGPLCAMFYYWILYMHNLTRGIQTAYMEDVTFQRMNYTVSIYRFRLDPSRRHITSYAKATGCFPKSVPLGAMFNFAENDLFAPEVGKFSIPFVANKIEYNDYAILQDFNTLSKRYWSDIDTDGAYIEIDESAGTNFSGVPFISTRGGIFETLSRDGKSIDENTYRDGGKLRLTFRTKVLDNQIPER